MKDFTDRIKLQLERYVANRILQLLHGQADLQDLMRQTVAVLREYAGCESVGVRLKEDDEYPYFESTRAGDLQRTEDQPCHLNPKCHGHRPRNDCMCGTVLTGRFDPELPFFTANGSFWTNRLSELAKEPVEGYPISTDGPCAESGYESVALVPLRTATDTFGMIQFADRSEGRFTAERVAFLEAIAGILVIGLARRKAEEEMQKAHADLERRVAERTAELQEARDKLEEKVRERTAAYSKVNKQLRQEVNERRRAEEELRRSEERYRLLAENARDVIFTIDLDFNYTYISPSVKFLRGFTPEEVIGQNVAGTLTPESLQAAGLALREELADEKENPDPLRHRTLELEMIHRDGSSVWTEARVSFLRDADGKPSGVLGVTRDITERVESERERKDVERYLRESQKMEAIGQLAGGIAHDFNNLLVGVLGGASLIRRNADEGSPTHKHALLIESSAKRAATLTDQLLAFAQEGKYDPVPVDLNEVVKQAIGFMPTSVLRNIEMVTDLSDAIEKVVADRTLMMQALTNLLHNAHEAMEGHGRIVIRTRLVEPGAVAGTTGPCVLVRVSDTGPGIPNDVVERVFDPFVTSRTYGRGLGLAAVYGIVQNHGGRIVVDKDYKEGASFSIYLPVAETG